MIVAVPWFAVESAFEGQTSALEPLFAVCRRMTASPIVTVNLWFDRPVLDQPFVGLPGRPVQWVFDKRVILGGTASHLALVSSGASPLVDLANDALVDRRTGSCWQPSRRRRWRG